MRISKSLLVAAAMLASAGVAQAQQNVTQATWIGADGQGGAGIWDKWNTAPTAHNYWAAKTAALVFTVTAGAGNGASNGTNLIRTTNTTGLQVGQLVTGTGIPPNSYITAVTAGVSFAISQNLTANAAGNYTASPLVSGVRLTTASTLTFNNTTVGGTADILVDSSLISSQSQTLNFTSSGYRLLPGTFPAGVQPLVSNFQDIDLARTLVTAPYTTAPNGTLQISNVTLTVAGVAGPISAQPYVTLRNPTSFGGNITATNADTTIILEGLVSSTIAGTFKGNGNIDKTGGAVLQYQGYTSRMFSYGTDTRPYSYVQTILGPSLSFSRTNTAIYGIRPRDLAPNLLVNDGANGERLAGLQGQMRVDGGLLMVSGHLNMWHDFGTTVDGNILTVGAQNEIPLQTANIAAGADSAILRYNLAKRMTGVSSVVLNGSSEVSFTNTPVNVGNGTTALRLNFLHNLKAGDNNDQFQTTVTTGPDDNYRLGIHIDQGVEGSVGILAGSGKVIKTGAGTLTVLNDSRMSGDFIAAGGRTVLSSATGLTFANSSSFNIAGTQDTSDSDAATTTEGSLGLSRRGADIRYQETPSNSANDPRVDYRPALFPDTGTVTITVDGAGKYTGVSRSGAEVVIVGDQTVHNFQADFALKSKGTTNVGNSTTGEVYTAADAVRTAADVNNKTELVVVGTGYGSNLFLNGSTLTINQDATGRDGFYNGSVYGADLTTGASGGRIVKTGGGTLVFLLQSGAYDYTEIQGGTFIANVQGLGQKEVSIGDGGTFAILQNNAGTLSANLTGSAGSTLKLLASATIDNGSGSKIEVNPGRDPGQVDVVTSQDGFYGNIVVNDGVNLSFSGGTNNTFVHANSITLNSGTTRETVLKFGDTSQLVRNLSGDQYSRIELGRGDITLEQNSGTAAFLGSITGVGSLIKQGTAAFTLVGNTVTGGIPQVNDSYYGATIVRPGGALVAGSANAIPNSSALVLVGAGSFVTGGNSQILGGLFGSAASSLNLGAATVTVGYTSARAASMTLDLAGANPLLADYLGTTDQVNPLLNVTTATATGGAASTVNVASTTGLAVGQIVKGTGIAADSIITGVGAGSIILSKPLTGTPSGALTATTTTTFTPTSGLSGSTQLTSGSSVGIAVGQAIVGTGIATGSYVTNVVANTSFGVAAGANGTNIIKTVSSGGLVVGQIVSGTGITNGTRITSITPNTSFVAGIGVVGTRKITTGSTAGLVVGQTVVGTGIPANATITGLTATEVTISANLTAAAKGTVAVGALIGLSSNLTAAAAGTVNVSALITLNQALTANLPNQPVNVGTVRSVDVTSLNLSAADLNSLYNGGIKMSELTRRYLTTVAVGTSIGNYTAPTTDISFAQALSFDGQLIGSGTLIKSGAEDLTLRGNSAGFTGQVQIAQGTLTINYDSLPSASALTIAAGANLVVSVADAYDPVTDSIKRTMTTPILGAGDFNKNGVGYLILNPNLSAGQVSYTGTTNVNAGWLEMKALATNGAAVIGTGAHLVLTTASDVTYSGLVSGAGQLEVRATNNSTLTAGGTMSHAGGTLVRAGTLLAQTGWAGATGGNIIVEAGAKARLNVATNLTAAGVFSGAGTIVKEGAGALTLLNPTTAFTGTYQSNAGTTVLAAANLFGVTSPNIAAIDLRGTSVLDVTANQVFRNLTGEATSTIAYGVNGVTITLPIDTGATNSFAGRFTRVGGTADATINKVGLGTLDLSPTAGVNQLTIIAVTEGRLIGTAAGYNGANIYVGAGAEAAFNAPTAGAAVTFNNNVSGIGGGFGTGTVVKVGAGEAILGAVNLLANTPDFKVEQGILTLTDSRAGTPAMLTANVSTDATFRVKLAGNRTLGNEISGTGILDLQSTVGGAVKVVTVNLQPSVTTTNIGGNVRLDVSNITAVTGITAETGSFLNIGLIGGANRTLTLTQSTDGVFNGTLEGTANFTLQGAGLFRYAGPLQATSVGTVTVNGGFLGVNVDNTKSVTLTAVPANGSTPEIKAKLGVFVDVGGNSIYNGALVGSAGAAQLVKIGDGTLNLTSGVTSSLKGDIFASYDVRQGTLMATLEADPSNPSGPGIILPDSTGHSRAVTLSGGTLALTVGASGGTLLSGAGTTNTGNLTITTVAGQSSTLNVLGNVTGNVAVTGGTVLTLGASGTSLLNITGNVAVTGGSKLTGSANIGGNLSVDAASTLAPGYSPGTQNITGNFTLAGTAIMEVSGDAVSGQYNDVVNFSGTADLNLGGTSTLHIARWNALGSSVAPAFGQRFVLFKGTATPTTGATLVSTYFVHATPNTVVTDDPTGRYLVVAPADGALNNTTVRGADGLIHNPNEYAVYAVRAPSGYVVAGLDSGILSYVQTATNVAAGTVATTVTDPLAGRLMTMTDAQLAPALLSLQPEGLASIPGAVVLGQRAEADALHRRLDMRRYDRAGYSVYNSEWFALGTSSSFKGGSGTGATPFDATVTGGLAGLVKDLNPWSVAGFSAGYSRTKSNLVAGGVSAGSVSGNAYRLTGFFSSMLGERKDSLFVDAGLSAGMSTNKSTRTTFLGTETADPKATSYGGFARFGAGYATKAGVSFSPFVGVDFAKVSGSGFTESGDATKLNVHSYSYTSARATLGTGMTWLSVGDGETLKFTLDFEAFSELGGGKTADIVADLNGTSFTSHVNVASGSGYRVAPSFTYGPTPDSAVYLTLSLEKAGATKTTGVEAGYRRRF